jgi:hypothetical protein
MSLFSFQRSNHRCGLPAAARYFRALTKKALYTNLASNVNLFFRCKSDFSPIEEQAKKARGHNWSETYGSGLLKDFRRRPTLPHSLPCSTIGAEELNFRVRDGNGCDLFAITTEKIGYNLGIRSSVAAVCSIVPVSLWPSRTTD